MKWFGRSGVPGLGVSVENHYQYSPALQLWDQEDPHTDHHPHHGHGHPEHDQSSDTKPRQTLRDKIVSKLRLRRRNTVKEKKELEDETKETSVKAPVRRSQSMVTTTRRKLGNNFSEIVTNLWQQPKYYLIINFMTVSNV